MREKRQCLRNQDLIGMIVAYSNGGGTLAMLGIGVAGIIVAIIGLARGPKQEE